MPANNHMIPSSDRLARLVDRVGEVLWAIALICLPLTSFPLLTSITNGLVAPFSILPFTILLLLVTLPGIIRKGALPKETLPLLAFILAAILSCAAAFFIFVPGFKGKTVPGQELRALVTLAVGLTFFLVTTSWIKNPARLKNTWKYITIGGILSLAWTGVQVIYVLRQANVYPFWVEQVQSFLVVHQPSFYPKLGRVMGFTYEASWFAHQMVIIYLPIWISATYHRTSAFSIRILHVSVENILLIFGLLAFFLSSPRIGLVSLLLIVLYLFIKLSVNIHHRLVERISNSPLFHRDNSAPRRGAFIGTITGISIIAIYLVILGGILLFAASRDWRLSTLVSQPPTMSEVLGVLTLNENTLLELSHRFVFLERMVYWMNGWNVFNHYPWLGVGLGNAGFFFPQYAPAIGWSSFEIRSVLYYLTQLPNVKSLWFRLLAETGVVGFSLFITWYYILYRSSKFSQNHRDMTVKTFAFAGQLALLAFIGEGLSIDSFAMPYFWVIAGIIAGIAMMYRQDILKASSSN